MHTRDDSVGLAGEPKIMMLLVTVGNWWIMSTGYSRCRMFLSKRALEYFPGSELPQIPVLVTPKTHQQKHSPHRALILCRVRQLCGVRWCQLDGRDMKVRCQKEGTGHRCEDLVIYLQIMTQSQVNKM